jgi:transposase-like protein
VPREAWGGLLLVQWSAVVGRSGSSSMKVCRPRGSRRTLGTRELGLRRWVDCHLVEVGKARVTSDERDELVRLRRENRVLRMERDLLSRAAAFFAGETSSRK